MVIYFNNTKKKVNFMIFSATLYEQNSLLDIPSTINNTHQTATYFQAILGDNILPMSIKILSQKV